LLELRDSPLKPSHYIEHAAKNLPQEWIDFITAIDAQQNARRKQRTDGCPGVGGMLDFVQMATDRFMRPDNPQAQLGEAEQMQDDKDAIPLMRDLADRVGTREARRELGQRLIKSKNPAESAEGLALLESLADSDELATETLIQCFSSGCGSVAPDPATATMWMEHAAGLGSLLALTELHGELVKSGNNTDAWAWAMYGLELATAGCLESNQPSSTWVLLDAQRAFDLDHLLDAAQRVQAQARLQTIRQHWESQATINLGCNL
jgi:TPR repeat protein